jgi:hypothetical protein
MAELFSETGQSTDISGPSPTLRGIFLPGIDRENFADGLGLVSPLGGGGTLRNYQGYGPSAAGGADFTQLRDLSNALGSFGAGETFNVNYEGLVGPQGPPGPPGPQGFPGLSYSDVYQSSANGLFQLTHNLAEIDALGTAADKFLYVSSYDQQGTPEFVGTETRPKGDVDDWWWAAGIDYDGSVMLVGIDYGRLYLSTNGGTSWTEKQPAGDADIYWYDCASDADGSVLVACTYLTSGEHVYVSTNSGSSWADRKPVVANIDGYLVDVSADGAEMIVGGYVGRLWTSINSGTGWTERQPTGDADRAWRGVGVNSTGTVFVACCDNSFGSGGVYVSADSGSTWLDKTPSGAHAGNTWRSVRVDSSGNKMIATIYGGAAGVGEVWTTTDGGTNWTKRQPNGSSDVYFQMSDIDDSGSNMIVAAASGRAYSSNDGGVTWTEITPAGSNDRNWRCLEISGDGTKGVIGCASSSAGLGRIYTLATGATWYEATWAEANVTAQARSLLDDDTQGDQQTTLGLGTGDSPEFTGLTLSGLTASKMVATDGSKNLISSDLAAFVTGTANEIDITDDGDGTVTIGIVDPLIVAKGGTGAASLTDHSILLGSGTDAITPLGVATNGQLPIGSTGADPVLAGLTGTANQITVTNGAGSITLATPQNIATDSDVQFNSVGIGGTPGGAGDRLCVYSANGVDKICLEHDNSDAYVYWTNGILVLKTAEENTNGALSVQGNGTGVGFMRVYSQDDSNYVEFLCQNNVGYLRTSGNILTLNNNGNYGISCFNNSGAGETQEFRYYGYRTGDQNRYMSISIGADAVDTASFDDIGSFWFNGIIKSTNGAQLGDGGTTNYMKLTSAGLLTFLGTAGLTYGFIYNDNNTIATVLTNQNTWYRSYDAAQAWTSGTSKDMTLGDGYIQVDTAGHYLAVWTASIDFSAAPGASQQVEGGFMVDPNTGTYAIVAGGLAHRTIANSTDTGDFMGVAVLDLNANDKVGLGFNNNSSAGKTIHNEHASLVLIQIAGT